MYVGLSRVEKSEGIKQGSDSGSCSDSGSESGSVSNSSSDSDSGPDYNSDSDSLVVNWSSTEGSSSKL